jgi:hypothetical protein
MCQGLNLGQKQAVATMLTLWLLQSIKKSFYTTPCLPVSLDEDFFLFFSGFKSTIPLTWSLNLTREICWKKEIEFGLVVQHQQTLLKSLMLGMLEVGGLLMPLKLRLN